MSYIYLYHLNKQSKRVFKFHLYLNMYIMNSQNHEETARYFVNYLTSSTQFKTPPLFFFKRNSITSHDIKIIITNITLCTVLTISFNVILFTCI